MPTEKPSILEITFKFLDKLIGSFNFHDNGGDGGRSREAYDEFQAEMEEHGYRCKETKDMFDDEGGTGG